jgi:hypothetical protein
MLEEMEAFVRQHAWQSPHSAGISRAFVLDLTDWPYAYEKPWEGPEAALHDITAMDPHMEEIRVSIYPKEHRYWRGRNAVGDYVAGKRGLASTRRFTADWGTSPVIHIMSGRSEAEMVRTLKHEMRHWTQQLLSILTVSPAGLPRRGAVTGKRAQRAAAHYDLQGYDPYRLQRLFVDELGESQHTGKRFAHARDPVEFYTRMGDLVDKLAEESARQYAAHYHTPSFTTKVQYRAIADAAGNALGEVPPWSFFARRGLRTVELTVQPEASEPFEAALARELAWESPKAELVKVISKEKVKDVHPQVFFNEVFRDSAEWEETIIALKGVQPRRYRKMLTEVYAQAYEKYEQLLPTAFAEQQRVSATRHRDRQARLKQLHESKKRKAKKGKSLPKKKGPPKKGTIRHDVLIAKTAVVNFGYSDAGAFHAVATYADGSTKKLYARDARRLWREVGSPELPPRPKRKAKKVTKRRTKRTPRGPKGKFLPRGRGKR